MSTDEKVKNPRGLTKKQRKLAKLVAQTGLTNREAFKQVYDVSPDTKQSTIDVMASQTINKPEVKQAINFYSQQVETVLEGALNDFGTSEDVRERGLAVDVAKFLHDKQHGKAKQQIQVQQSVVTINLDFTSSLDDDDIS